MRKLYFLLLTVCFNFFASAQTTLVNSGFEAGDPTVWTLANAVSTNQWFMGSLTASTGTNSAYVTADAGVTNSYNLTTISSNHIYTPVTFPAGQTAIILQFDWRNMGEHTGTVYDYIRVSLMAAAPVGGTMPATADQLPVVFTGAGTYLRAWVVIPASYAGTTRNLVFTWRNDGSGGTNTPGPSIDNILLTSATPSPLTGTKTIQGGGDFTTFSAAIANLNAHGVGGGGVTFQIPAGSTFSETPPAITASGTAANPIVFRKNGAGANPLLTATTTGNWGPTSTTTTSGTGDAGIVIIGGDYITFDGIDVASGDWLPGTSLVDFGYKIINSSATEGAKNNTIQNCSITLNRTNTASAGILQSSGTTGGGVTATNATGANSNNRYYNIAIQNSYFGINLNGAATTAANTDANNEIGVIAGGSTVIGASYAGTPTGDIGGGSTATYGIQAVNQTSVSIHHTEIRNITATTTLRGIFLDGCQGTSNVHTNKVYGLRNTSTTSTSAVNGIELDMAATGTYTINAYNNFVTDVSSAYTGAASATRQLKGFLLGSSATTSIYNVDHNSVRIDGSGSPNISSVALEFGSNTVINNVRNNILANFTGAQSGVAKHYAIRSNVATAFGAASSVSNYNDLFIDNTTNGFVGLTNTTDRATVADWTAALTGNPNTDANSINVNPDFISAINLHISPSSSSVDGRGTPLGSVTTDIDGDARQSPPDIGADEYTVLTGVDMGVTALVAPVATGCYTNAETVTVTIKNTSSAVHDFAANPVTVTVNVTGATTYSSNLVVNAGTLAVGASQNVTMPATLDMTPAGTYTFNANTTVAGDISPANDAMSPAIRTVAPTIALPETVDFTGFTGANLTAVFPNWSEGLGASVPSGTTSDWTLQSGWAGGNVTAKINLDAVADIDWIVGPKFTATANSVLKFDVAITDFASVDPVDANGGMSNGTDDKVIVKISTDCGATFTDLFTFDATNTGSITNVLTPQSISLSAYAGQSVIIAFFGTEGTVNDAPDYDFHIDNINIYNLSAIDMGATTLVAPPLPPGNGCYTASETVTVTIKNYGSSTIDFAVNPVTVTTNVTGAATATLMATVNTGTLAADATLNVNMSSTLNMTAAGTYTFNASTSVSGDGEVSNDAMTQTTRTNAPIVTLPQTVDFTGFTGSNLNAVFPNWTEGSDETLPTGTTSSWTSSTVIPGSGTTARINLSATTDREWIIGPKFAATSTSQLKFKVAITDNASAAADPAAMAGSDDQVIVKVSTDCGASWSDLQVFDDGSTTGVISNTLVEQTISLAPYAGQTVIIAFYATEGTVDDAASYDFHIDDINIENQSPIDLMATALVSPIPPGTTCYTSSETVTVTIKNNGSSTLDFSSTPVTVNTNVTGAATAMLTGTLNTGTLAPGATVNVTMSTTLDMTAGGTYTFNSSTSIAGDGNPTNDAMAPVNRTNAPTVATPQTVDFTGFTGSNLNTVFPNWIEGSGTPVPTGTTSNWTSSTVFTAAGTTARINLSTTTDREWIIGPKFNATASSRLKFKIAITDASSVNADPAGMAGTDDQVIVKISTDCGNSWSDLQVFDDGSTTGVISNTLVEQTISLAAYAGQPILIAFYATEGTVDDAPSYDFHIDDINIESPPPIDAGAITLVAPVTKACYSNAETVTIRIKNFGTATLDFTATPVTVTTNVSGAVTQVLNATVNTGTLAPEATLDVTMSTTLDMTTIGTYTFNASTSIAGDGLATNDAMVSVNRAAVTVVAGTVSSNANSICVSGAPTLTLAGSAGGNIQWQESTASATGPWTNVGTNNTVYTPGSSITGITYYQAVVSCGANTATSNVVTVNYENPTVTGTTPASRCGSGTLILGATGSAATLKWYAAATGGTPLGTGSSFTTPSVSSTTDFYVAAATGAGTSNVGATSKSIGTGATSNVNHSLFFTLSADATINSVDIYPNTSGQAGIIEITNSGGTTVLNTINYTTNASGGNTVQTVPVNVTLGPGSYRMRQGSPLISLFRNDAGALHPYTSGPVSITGNTFDPLYYYYFYNWSISVGCESPRTVVTATVTPITTLAGTIGGPQVCDMQDVSDNTYADNSCGAIAKVVPFGASPVSGNVNTCVKIDGTVQTYNGMPYVQRHFDIEPATNASTATARVTFYALQSEFDTYNSNNGMFPDLPTGPGDATGIGNLRITQFHGTGTAPGNYTGAAQLIDPADASIVWNATNSWWEITIDVTGFSGFYIHTTLNGPLPANLLTFAGQRIGNANQLKWTVAQEVDVKSYEVERSENGRIWSKAGSVVSLGNTNSQRSYGFTDNNINGVKQYYRLRQLDRNGSEKLSNIVVITGIKPTILTLSGLFPNPAITKVNMLVDAPMKDNVTIVVMDAVGKVVKTQKGSIEAGSNTLQLNVSGLSQGSYLVKITCESNNESAVSKFIKE